MARNTMGDVSEAFDMFLDTISNAFGGIIFISLLVCILLQITGTPPPAVDAEAQKQLRNQIAKTQKEIEDLNQTRQSRINQVRALGPLADNDLVKKYLEAMEKAKKSQEQYEAIAVAVGEADVQTATLRAQFEKVDATLKELLRKKEDLVAKGKPEKLSPPVAGVSQKKQVPVLISGGRLAFCLDYDDSGTPTAENTQDVSVIQNDRGKSLMPRLERGLAIRPDDTAALDKLFHRFTPAPTGDKKDKDCHAVFLVVWPDSYAQCEIVRDYLIKNGFEYGLMMMTAGESVPVSNRPGVSQTFRR